MLMPTDKNLQFSSPKKNFWKFSPDSKRGFKAFSASSIVISKSLFVSWYWNPSKTIFWPWKNPRWWSMQTSSESSCHERTLLLSESHAQLIKAVTPYNLTRKNKRFLWEEIIDKTRLKMLFSLKTTRNVKWLQQWLQQKSRQKFKRLKTKFISNWLSFAHISYFTIFYNLHNFWTAPRPSELQN